MEVKLGKAEVKGIDSQYSGLVVVRAPVTPMPDAPWKQLFERNPHFTGWPMSLQGPKLVGSEVTIAVPDADIEKAVAALRERVAAVNSEYAQRVAPQIEAEKRRREEEEAERRKRLENAQRKLDELGES